MRNAVVSGGNGRIFLLNELLNKAITALHFIRRFVQCFKEKEKGGDIYLNTKKGGGYPIKLFLLHKVVSLYPFASIHPNYAPR